MVAGQRRVCSGWPCVQIKTNGGELCRDSWPSALDSTQTGSAAERILCAVSWPLLGRKLLVTTTGLHKLVSHVTLRVPLGEQVLSLCLLSTGTQNLPAFHRE